MASEYTQISGNKDPAQLTCVICGVALPVTARVTFCEVHVSRYEARQRERVATEELAFQWNDSIANWRERPVELDGEPDINHFVFRRKWEDWLFFMRGYTDRCPDWITVNHHTGEIRRFVEVGECDVQDDLRGTRPSPNQTDFAHRWGQSKPRESFQEYERKHYGDEQGQVSIPKLIQAATMPIYGVIGSPFGLTVRSFNWGHAGYRLVSVGFTFALPTFADARASFSITSFDSRERSIAWEPVDSSGNPLINENARLFESYHLNSEERAAAGSPQLVENDFTIAGVLFSGELRYWSQPYPLFGFFLKHEEAILVGSAFGLSQQDVMQLLEQLIILNNRAELLAQYQTELEQSRDSQRQQRKKK